MRWTDEYRLETPEQIELDMELAGIGSRFVGQLYDWLLKAFLTLALVAAVALAAAFLGLAGQLENASPLVVAAGVIAGFLLWMAYDIYFEALHGGQTPGKKVAGVRVIGDGGGPIDFRAACVRNLLGLADALPLFYVLGAVLVLVTGRRQRLGDLAAGTVVVRERVASAPGAAPAAVAELASDEFRFSARHLEACSPGDRQILRSFLEREGAMEGASRDRLARSLTETMLRKTAYEPERPVNTGRRAREFLASLFRDLEEQARRNY